MPRPLDERVGRRPPVAVRARRLASAKNELAFADDRPAPLPDAFTDVPGVLSARTEGGIIDLRVGQLHAVLPAVLDRVGQGGMPLTRLTTRHASLEDVFVQLTGRHLRDEGKPDAMVRMAAGAARPGADA